jgi:tRNA (cytidine/uridine-2'-O-)-methyltransferase
MKIILYQPQIPQNTGNIVRTCSVTGTDLVLVEPLGFSINDRWLKRAGLDYWEGVQLNVIDNLEAYLESYPHNFYFFSSHGTQSYADIHFAPEDALVFGSETCGLPEEFQKRWPDRFVTLPMIPSSRCLNLATSAGIALYEAWRQQGFQSTKH